MKHTQIIIRIIAEDYNAPQGPPDENEPAFTFIVLDLQEANIWSMMLLNNDLGGHKMVTFVGAPWKAVENALEKVMELEKMLQSKELKELTKKMENNFPLQNSSTTNINSFLENNGVKVPQGITFNIAARKSNAHRADFRVTIDVPVPQPSGSSKK